MAFQSTHEISHPLMFHVSSDIWWNFWFFSPTQRKSELCIAISGVQVQGRWGSGCRGVGHTIPSLPLAPRCYSCAFSSVLSPVSVRVWSLGPLSATPAVCGSISFSRTPVTGPPTQASPWPPVKLPVLVSFAFMLTLNLYSLDGQSFSSSSRSLPCWWPH